MRLHRPVLAGLALGALLPVSAAEAATGLTAAGSAVSTATLADLSVGALLDVVEATHVSIGSLSATAQTLSKSAPAVTFVPITLNGVKNGAVTVTPANSPKTVGGISTGAAPLSLLSATSPGATLSATDGAAPSSKLTSSLGEAKILGLPIVLDGGLTAGSITDAKHAEAGKGLTISEVSLPNIADLLGALGIDIHKLPVGTLNALVGQLGMALDTATQQALDAANTAYDTAAQNLDDAQDTLATETAEYAAAVAAFNEQLSSVDVTGIDLGVVSAPLDNADWDALPTETRTAIAALPGNEGITAAAAAYETAKTQYNAAAAAIAGLESAVSSALDAIADLVDGVLAGVPLVEIGSAKIATKAAVGAAKTATVTGAISGVKVLGTDVLAEVTGDSELDVAKVVGDVAADVNAQLADLSAALSNALSGVTGATGLVVPAPKIELLTKKTVTGTDGAFGTATTTVTALSVSLGSATIPAVYALEDAAALAGIAEITSGFKTAPLAMKVGTLVESARFRPASTTTTPGSGPTHPSTGAPAGLALVAVVGTAVAIGVRRRLNAAAE